MQKEFYGLTGKTFGVNQTLNVPREKIDCSKLFGEFYVYLSCLNLCIDSKCPIAEAPLKYDDCPRQYPNRFCSLTDNSKLTFVTKSEVQGYTNNYFQCNNIAIYCIQYSKVCDLTDDCGDMSDEIGCTNHFQCEDDSNHLISLDQQCDGIYDCFDLSDECDEACNRRKQILEHWILKSLCWSLGLMAITFNAMILIRTIKSIKSAETGSMLMTQVLVSLISIGDLLIGVYLVVLSVYDSFIYRDEYCSAQARWLSSTPCAVLGVISTIGSQMSLFSMTSLSLIRVIGITYSDMTAPSRVNKRWLVKIVSVATTIIALTLSLALVPLAPSFEDYFVQGIYYDEKNKLFVGFAN